jgi:hypothetical protein
MSDQEKIVTVDHVLSVGVVRSAAPIAIVREMIRWIDEWYSHIDRAGYVVHGVGPDVRVQVRGFARPAEGVPQQVQIGVTPDEPHHCPLCEDAEPTT